MKNKLSILVLLPFPPFPPDDGGKIASYTFVENLRSRCDFTVVMPVYSKEQFDSIEKQRKLWGDVKLVSAQYAVPGLRSRVFALARKIYPFFRKWITSEGSSFYNDELLYPFLRSNTSYFDTVSALLADNRYDIIQVENTLNLSLVNLLPQGIKKIYVDVESRYSLLNDYVSLEPLDKKAYCSYVTENVKTMEAAFLSKYDAIIAYSKDDQKRLQSLLPGKAVYKSPLNLIDESLTEVLFDDFSIEKIVFVGHEAHLPNKDAVIWFIDEIFPNISHYGKVFYVVGKWSKDFSEKYRAYKNIVFTGYVDDINSFIRNSLNVVPIRLGGCGLRMKVLLSISNGVPVLSTSKAGYGFDFTNGRDVIFAETSSDFVREISALLECPEKARALAQNALLLYKNNYSVALTTEMRNNIYIQVMGQGDEHSSS